MQILDDIVAGYKQERQRHQFCEEWQGNCFLDTLSQGRDPTSVNPAAVDDYIRRFDSKKESRLFGLGETIYDIIHIYVSPFYLKFLVAVSGAAVEHYDKEIRQINIRVSRTKAQAAGIVQNWCRQYDEVRIQVEPLIEHNPKIAGLVQRLDDQRAKYLRMLE